MMPLPFWEVEKIHLGEREHDGGDWLFRNMQLATCPRCDSRIIIPISWPERNSFGTAPCPICFKTSRIPRKDTR